MVTVGGVVTTGVTTDAEVERGRCAAAGVAGS